MPLDPELAPLLQLLASGTPLEQMSAPDAREAFKLLALGAHPEGTLTQVGSVKETEVAGAEGPLRARVYRPSVDGPVPTIAMFHGGGFVIGDLDTHDNMARLICAGTGAVVVSVDYRLAPEHRFPAAPLDCIAAARDIAARLPELGGSDVLAVAGDSAGGNLAAVVTQHVPGIKAQLLIYPFTDAAGDYPSMEENAKGYFLEASTMMWFVANYLPEDVDPLDPLLSPLRGRLEGLPPAVVATAEFDPLRDGGVAYAEALAAIGVPVEHTTYAGLIHGFFDMDVLSSAAREAVAESVKRFAALL